MPATGKKSERPRAERRSTKTPARKRTFIEEARRNQILDAALALFAKRGYNETSLADIAAVLGISKGVISYHFEGKSELGAETLRHMVRRYSEFIQARLDAKRTARDKILELPAACLDFAREGTADYLVYLDTLGSFGTPTERRRFMAWAEAGMRARICNLLSEAQEREQIPKFPVQPVADLLQAAIDGLSEQAATAPQAVDLEASKLLLQQLLTAVLDGRVELRRR